MNFSKIIRLIQEGTLVKKGYRKLFHMLIEPIFSKIVVVFPVNENRILFDNFGGKGYGDNPRYIAEEIYKEEKKLELIWLVDNLSDEVFPNYIIPVKIDTIKGLFMRATSKVWVDNIRHLHPVAKRKNQIYLQTWHAPFSPKKLEKDAEESLGEKYIKQAQYDGLICDAILANSKLQENQYLRAFWLDAETEILRCGLPRNDYLANSKNNCEEYKRVREKYNLVTEDIYILYAPTFRDDMSAEGYELDYVSIIRAFESLTEKKCHVVVRLHPNVTKQDTLVKFDGNKIINGTHIANMQELSVACDYVISDYSTSLFDFVILDKPAFICALDLEKYKKLRGLLPEFEQFPFPMATSNSEFVKIIEEFDSMQYQKQIEDFLEKYPIYDSGDAAKKATDWIFKKMEQM